MTSSIRDNAGDGGGHYHCRWTTLDGGDGCQLSSVRDGMWVGVIIIIGRCWDGGVVVRCPLETTGWVLLSLDDAGARGR